MKNKSPRLSSAERSRRSRAFPRQTGRKPREYILTDEEHEEVQLHCLKKYGYLPTRRGYREFLLNRALAVDSDGAMLEAKPAEDRPAEVADDTAKNSAEDHAPGPGTEIAETQQTAPPDVIKDGEAEKGQPHPASVEPTGPVPKNNDPVARPTGSQPDLKSNKNGQLEFL